MLQKTAGAEKTSEAVRQQIEAMGWDVFEVGLFNPEAVGEPIMLPRTWDRRTLLHSVPWMRLQNRNGRNVYVRPKGEHNLSLVDDLTADAITAMKGEGFSPALVVRTSPGNHQAWLKHPRQLDRELGTAVARALAERFGGDRGAADWRHFGRLAGFANRKRRHCDSATGLYPFVLLLEAGGHVYPEAERFLTDVSTELEGKHQERRRFQERASSQSSKTPTPLKNIDAFRSDARYGGDGNRIDLAYAIYAFAHGIGIAEVSAAVRSRDLSHKGNERRQDDYVERTIKKALDACEGPAAGRGR
jgi:RepB DNA-primase from phage plasmid